MTTANRPCPAALRVPSASPSWTKGLDDIIRKVRLSLPGDQLCLRIFIGWRVGDQRIRDFAIAAFTIHEAADCGRAHTRQTGRDYAFGVIRYASNTESMLRRRWMQAFSAPVSPTSTTNRFFTIGCTTVQRASRMFTPLSANVRERSSRSLVRS